MSANAHGARAHIGMWRRERNDGSWMAVGYDDSENETQTNATDGYTAGDFDRGDPTASMVMDADVYEGRDTK